MVISFLFFSFLPLVSPSPFFSLSPPLLLLSSSGFPCLSCLLSSPLFLSSCLLCSVLLSFPCRSSPLLAFPRLLFRNLRIPAADQVLIFSSPPPAEVASYPRRRLNYPAADSKADPLQSSNAEESYASADFKWRIAHSHNREHRPALCLSG